MYEKLIKNNIGYLNKHMVRGFLENKRIYISDEEASVITRLVKDNWSKLYHKDYEEVFRELKSSVKKETYDQLLSLYLTSVRDFL